MTKTIMILAIAVAFVASSAISTNNAYAQGPPAGNPNNLMASVQDHENRIGLLEQFDLETVQEFKKLSSSLSNVIKDLEGLMIDVSDQFTLFTKAINGLHERTTDLEDEDVINKKAINGLHERITDLEEEDVTFIFPEPCVTKILDTTGNIPPVEVDVNWCPDGNKSVFWIEPELGILTSRDVYVLNPAVIHVMTDYRDSETSNNPDVVCAATDLAYLDAFEDKIVFKISCSGNVQGFPLLTYTIDPSTFT